jgi:hypothetical protein
MQHSAKTISAPDLRCSCRDVHGERAGFTSNAAVTCDVTTGLQQPKEC